MSFSSGAVGPYLAILRRRWVLIAFLVIIDVAVGVVLFARTYQHLGYQACQTLYVADTSAPSLISAPPTTLETAGQLLAGETAANFFADDVLDVAGSQHVAVYISVRLKSYGLPNTAEGDINGAIGGSRKDRTVSLCVSNPNEQSSLAISDALSTAMTSQRARFLGSAIAHRTYIGVVSNPSAGKASSRSQLISLGLRLFLGLLVGLGLALLWDAIDPTVRGRSDLVSILDVPVVAV